MTTLKASDWLDVVQREYLDDFIPNGGAAVKFAVSCDGTPTAMLGEKIATVASDRGYVVARISATDTRMHMLDKLFNAVAERIPWVELATQRLGQLAVDSFKVPDDFDDRPVDEQLAAAGSPLDYVRLTMNLVIANRVLKDHDLARDFRIAMTWLCKARLTGTPESATQLDAITGWLTGRVQAISNMKGYQIYTKINRTNARHHFESLFTWVRKCGKPGTVIVIDGAPFTEARPPIDGSVNYTRNALLDAYEVLRQFIDSTDHLSSALIVVTADKPFLDIEPGSRGLGAYPALMNRIFDEVRDRNLANPMSSLQRLTLETS